jgi:hypothetical protein
MLARSRIGASVGSRPDLHLTNSPIMMADRFDVQLRGAPAPRWMLARPYASSVRE